MKKYIKASYLDDGTNLYSMLADMEEHIYNFTNDAYILKQEVKLFEQYFTMDSYNSHNLKITLENLEGLLHSFNNAVLDAERQVD